MTMDSVMGLFNQAVYLAFQLAAPALVASLVIGLIISILQAATQIHEQTLTFAPKVIVVALVLLATGPWMMNNCIDFMHYVFDMAATTGLAG